MTRTKGLPPLHEQNPAQLTDDEAPFERPYVAFRETGRRMDWLHFRLRSGLVFAARYRHLTGYSYSRGKGIFALNFCLPDRWAICHGGRVQPVLFAIAEERCDWIAEMKGSTQPEVLPYIEHIRLAGRWS